MQDVEASLDFYLRTFAPIRLREAIRFREWPECHPGYYGVFLRDPDGANVAAVHHG